MGLISIGEAEMSGQTVEVAQGEEVKRREGRDANKTNERTWRTNKSPLRAERNGGDTLAVKRKLFLGATCRECGGAADVEQVLMCVCRVNVHVCADTPVYALWETLKHPIHPREPID